MGTAPGGAGRLADSGENADHELRNVAPTTPTGQTRLRTTRLARLTQQQRGSIERGRMSAKLS